MCIITETEYQVSEVHPRTGRAGPEGEYRYSSTLSLTLALDGGEWSWTRPAALSPRGEAAATVQGPKFGLD